MRGLASLVAAAGLVAVALAGVSLRDRFLPSESVAQAVLPAHAAGAAPEPAPSAAPPPVAPHRVRPVAPDVVAAPPVDRQALERVEPRQPLSEIGAARSPSEGPPAETILFRPVVTGGGSFTSLGYRVELAGIQPIAAEASCDGGGVAWPCGVHARTAFRNWLRGRALTCVVPPVPTGDVVVSRCLLGTRDAAAWLVSYGWAKALPGGDYAPLEEKARVERRGMFGPAPAVPLAAEVPERDSEASPAIDSAPTAAEPLDSGFAPVVSEPLPDVFGLSGG